MDRLVRYADSDAQENRYRTAVQLLDHLLHILGPMLKAQERDIRDELEGRTNEDASYNQEDSGTADL